MYVCTLSTVYFLRLFIIICSYYISVFGAGNISYVCHFLYFYAYAFCTWMNMNIVAA